MTLSEVRKKTPNFLNPMLRECATVAEFRAALSAEIYSFTLGENPLQPAQFAAIQKLRGELAVQA